MAKVDPTSIFSALHGKISKAEKLVLSRRHGATHAWEINIPPDNPTESQKQNRSRFAQAMAHATAAMHDPIQKHHWQQIAQQSDGQYKTARGAAFAHYYKQLP